jgi:hypothetical protein
MNRIAFAFNNADHAYANGIAVSEKKYVVNMVQDLKATYKKPDTEEIFEAMIPTLISRGVWWLSLRIFITSFIETNIFLSLGCRARRESSRPSASSRSWFRITRSLSRLLRRLKRPWIKLSISSFRACNPILLRKISHGFVERITFLLVSEPV